MTSDWLYPISHTAGREFVDTKRRVPVSFASFRDQLVSGKIQDDRWYLATNFHRVEAGDRVWVYTGEAGLGIIGVGTITEVDHSRGEHDIIWSIDRAASTALCDHPFPASEVRTFVPFPRAAVVGLDQHPRLVRRLERWVGLAPKAAELRLERVGLRPRRVAHRKAVRAKTVDLAHDRVLAPLDTLFRGAGWDVGVYDLRPVRIDLAAAHRTKRRLVIVEAKVLPSRGPGRNEARTALGQLLEYSWRLRHHSGAPKHQHTLWAAFSRRPDPDVVSFLSDHDVVVSWNDPGGTSRFARGSQDRWEGLQ